LFRTPPKMENTWLKVSCFEMLWLAMLPSYNKEFLPFFCLACATIILCMLHTRIFAIANG
ncbi:hypothetical protein, partial [Psychrobacter sp. UBA3483]